MSLALYLCGERYPIIIRHHYHRLRDRSEKSPAPQSCSNFPDQFVKKKSYLSNRHVKVVEVRHALVLPR